MGFGRKFLDGAFLSSALLKNENTGMGSIRILKLSLTRFVCFFRCQPMCVVVFWWARFRYDRRSAFGSLFWLMDLSLY